MYEDTGNPRQFNDNLQIYVDRLGGRITGRGKAMCLCPAHGDKNPSLAVTSAGGRLLFHCHAGCPQGDVLEALAARGLWMCQPQAETRYTPPQRPQQRPSNAGLALKLWQAAVPAAGTLAEAYLDGRGLMLPGEADIRFHPACPFTVDGDRSCHPALVGLMTEVIGGAPAGIQRIALDRDGANLVDRGGRKVKMTLGGTAQSCVRLQSDVEIFGGIHIAEGIETAIGAWQRGYNPMWAMVSCARIKAMPLIKFMDCVTICADHDPPGLDAAWACFRRWNDAGREAIIRWREEPGKDWADA